MKLYCTSLLFLVAMQGLAQEIKLSPAIGIGTATGQMRRTFVFAKDLHVGAELPLGKAGVLSVSVGGASSQYAYSDTIGVQVFVSKSLFTVPIAWRKYYRLSVQSSYFIELGLAPAIPLGERRETRAQGKLSRKRFRGSDPFVGFISSIGYKRVLSGATSVSFGFNNYVDIFPRPRNNVQLLRQNKTVFALAFYKKLMSTPKPKIIEPL